MPQGIENVKPFLAWGRFFRFRPFACLQPQPPTGQTAAKQGRLGGLWVRPRRTQEKNLVHPSNEQGSLERSKSRRSWPYTVTSCRAFSANSVLR
jgi:hypothetical protein